MRTTVAATTPEDGVVAAHHMTSGGGGLVAGGSALTGRAGMVPIGSQGMGLAIKELLAIAGCSDSDRHSRGNSKASGGPGSL